MSSAILQPLTRIQFYVLLFSLPFEYYFRGREHTLLSTLKLQMVLLGATWFAAQLTDRGLFRDARTLVRLLPDRLAVAALVFVTVQLAAAAFAPAHRANAWTAGVKTAVGVCLALVSASLTTSTSERRRDLLLVVLCVSGTCVALLGFGERAGIGLFVKIVDVFQPSRFFLGNHLRMVSTMEYPNTAASFFSVTICATLALMLFPASGSTRALRGACPLLLALQVLALTLTFSRGAMGATVAGIAVAALAVRKSGWNRRSAFGLLFCLSLLTGGMTYLTLLRRTAEVEKPVIPKRVAHFGLDAGGQAKALKPGTIYTETIAVQNQSSDVWRRGQQGLAYRWYNFQTKVTSPLLLGAEFTSDILPQESARIPVALQTPGDTGQFLLIWFVFVRDDGLRELKGSFSPGIVCSVGTGPASLTPPSASPATKYTGAIQGERRTLNETLVPPRGELWSAALKMARQRPLLGMGPDNFRLLKWTYMELPKGDETILANSLYFEMLSGSGVLGCVAFLWLAWEFGRRISRSATRGDVSARCRGIFGIGYLAAFMTHGLVDYFLKFTPTFLLFWLLVGALSAEEVQATGNSQDVPSAKRRDRRRRPTSAVHGTPGCASLGPGLLSGGPPGLKAVWAEALLPSAPEASVLREPPVGQVSRQAPAGAIQQPRFLLTF